MAAAWQAYPCVQTYGPYICGRPSLTPRGIGCLATAPWGANAWQAVTLQVVGIKALHRVREGFALQLSDGECALKCCLAVHLAHLVQTSAIKQGSIVTVKTYYWVLVVEDLVVDQTDAYYIGSPQLHHFSGRSVRAAAGVGAPPPPPPPPYQARPPAPAPVLAPAASAALYQAAPGGVPFASAEAAAAAPPYQAGAAPHPVLAYAAAMQQQPLQVHPGAMQVLHQAQRPGSFDGGPPLAINLPASWDLARMGMAAERTVQLAAMPAVAAGAPVMQPGAATLASTLPAAGGNASPRVPAAAGAVPARPVVAGATVAVPLGAALIQSAAAAPAVRPVAAGAATTARPAPVPAASAAAAAVLSSARAASAGPPPAPTIDPVVFYCPITQALMRDPVLASDGNMYERTAIESWIAQKEAAGMEPTSPLTNLPLSHIRLEPVRWAREVIACLVDAGMLSWDNN